ncbi:D-lyxose/D-mannose family sugar isomerase [Botrimarina hoheduenensis]|uniref:D-lyxose ketol-isomerase n=1 Tax=Botrimarina hoheduenensis TaxID=2528000 RepID=A0A5C5VY25_9BACT|nr:D-lyxose/D-mannose family sugar isomerase [Botrimarina hoheduenensis]TWT42905.1 D-lyxose ketol-isomerase [Botrimarina hoheduenensis]
MKRSQINQAVRDATVCFIRHGWTLPPNPRWDVTDFGRDDFRACGLVLVNLAEEPEYCEKLMFAYPHQITPAHTHRLKKEDIICRHGVLEVRLWPASPEKCSASDPPSRVRVDGQETSIDAGSVLVLQAGSRVTLEPGVFHSFWAAAEDTIIGEVSTANDDLTDNLFAEPVSRFTQVEEDEPALVRLVSDPVL